MSKVINFKDELNGKKFDNILNSVLEGNNEIENELWNNEWEYIFETFLGYEFEENEANLLIKMEFKGDFDFFYFRNINVSIEEIYGLNVVLNNELGYKIVNALNFGDYILVKCVKADSDEVLDVDIADYGYTLEDLKK